MPTKSFFLDPNVHAYLVEHGTPPDPIQQELIEETRRLGDVSMMQVAPEQGAYLTILARILGARRALEVGTFTGYSALCIARGLPEDGRLLCCDVHGEWAAVAQRYWQKAELAHKIELRLAPALETLRSLPDEPAFDLAFIDADKTNYVSYYEEILRRLNSDGVILADNVLWGGNVAKPDASDENTLAIREFNAHVAHDPRVDCVMLAISDGLTLLRKR